MYKINELSIYLSTIFFVNLNLFCSWFLPLHHHQFLEKSLVLYFILNWHHIHVQTSQKMLRSNEKNVQIKNMQNIANFPFLPAILFFAATNCHSSSPDEVTFFTPTVNLINFLPIANLNFHASWIVKMITLFHQKSTNRLASDCCVFRFRTGCSDNDTLVFVSPVQTCCLWGTTWWVKCLCFNSANSHIKLLSWFISRTSRLPRIVDQVHVEELRC